MLTGYTAFVTYLLKSNKGYGSAIHCNYIKSVGLNTLTPNIEEIKISFPELTDFKFLSTNVNSGYTANNIYIILQLVSGGTNIIPVPTPGDWKIIDVTNQIQGHIAGALLTPQEITGTLFRVPFNNYESLSRYTINQNLPELNYPSALPVDENKLSFGDETYFMGNVTTNIHADVYTTNILIPLLLGEYNYSNNPTWDGMSVFASEVGIYDNTGNLVAIGKFNNPIEKNSQISRTIQFAIDF